MTSSSVWSLTPFDHHPEFLHTIYFKTTPSRSPGVRLNSRRYAMNISRFFVDHPIFAGVISVLIFVAGLIAMFELPISEYPEVAPPSVVVNASYPGANPKVIAETVARPLEEQLAGTENMLYMFSQATTDGRLTLNVTFCICNDPDLEQQKVQNRLSTALS